MPSENNVKKRPAEEEPELAAVRAFVEHAFPLWVTRVSPDKLANGVAEMSVRWAQAGHNVPQVSNALKTQLAMDIPPEKILDILFAWEEVHKSRYLPETGKFMPLRQASGSRKSSASETEKKASIKALESKTEELEKGLARAEKERSRSSKEDWLALPLTVQTIQDYRDSTTGLTGWMIDVLDMVSNAVEENILDDPPVIQASDIWALVVKAQKQYERKYARFGKGSKSSKKKRRSKSRSPRRSRSDRGRRHRRFRSRSRSRSRSARSESAGSSGDDTEVEYYYRGKFRFCEIDGIEYVVSASGKRWRTDRPPPGDCDFCGGRHWEWKCSRRHRR